MMTDNKYKTLAIAGAGVSLGILGAYMLKKRH
jgi:predicted NAD/FAD-binding protein